MQENNSPFHWWLCQCSSVCTPHWHHQTPSRFEQTQCHRAPGCSLQNKYISCFSLRPWQQAQIQRETVFLSTFKDVLAEVKHAFLDSVSLLRDLHVFIHLIKDTSCIRSLCTKIHNPTHWLISFFRKRTVGLLSPLTAGLWSPVCRTGSHGSAGPQTPHMQRFQSQWAAPGKKGQKK